MVKGPHCIAEKKGAGAYMAPPSTPTTQLPNPSPTISNTLQGSAALELRQTRTGLSRDQDWAIQEEIGRCTVLCFLRKTANSRDTVLQGKQNKNLHRWNTEAGER